MGEEQEASASVAVVGYIENDVDEWNMESHVCLDEVELVGLERCLRQFQDNGRPIKRKVPGNISETLKFTTELVNLEGLSEAGLSTELVSVRSALAFAQAEAKQAQNQSALLQQKKHE